MLAATDSDRQMVRSGATANEPAAKSVTCFDTLLTNDRQHASHE